MPHPHTLTWATPTDHAELADVIFDAVRNGPSQYTQAQRAAWMPQRRSGPEWDARLTGKDIILGRDAARILGLMSIDPGGYIDFAFIRREAQGTGLFRALFGIVEHEVVQIGDQDFKRAYMEKPLSP